MIKTPDLPWNQAIKGLVELFLNYFSGFLHSFASLVWRLKETMRIGHEV